MNAKLRLMQLQNFLDDRQPDTAAGTGTPVLLIHFVIPFPDVIQLVLADSLAMVFHLNADLSLPDDLANLNPPVIGRIVDRVVDEIVQYLRQAL